MDRFLTKSAVIFLILVQIGLIFGSPVASDPSAAVPEDVEDRRELSKRGGARAFYSFYNSGNSKRDNVAAVPYYLYEKRGGGRAFNRNNADLYYRFDKRGGGRAFAGSWSPYLERFYDYKRSSYPIYFTDSSYY